MAVGGFAIEKRMDKFLDINLDIGRYTTLVADYDYLIALPSRHDIKERNHLD
jgi:hypothetical protein